VTPVLGAATGTSFQGIIGNVTPAAGSFTTLGASSTATLNTLASSGATLTGGTINGMTVGATTPAVGTFTTLAANSEAIATQLTLGGVVASGVATGIALRTGSTKTAWLVGAQFNANNAFEISPSTAAGGTTFNTPAFLIDSSSNVGIGTTSPASKLDVSGGMRAVSSAPSIPASGAGLEIYYASGTFTGTPSAYLISYDRTSAAYKPFNFDGSNYIFRTSGTASLTLDSSGNLGLGVTPSAWEAGYQVLENSGGSLFSGSNSVVRTIQGGYINSGYKYKHTSIAASLYEQNAGAHQWYNAPSGTAGNAISFTTAMTLDASGNLLVGTTTPVYNASGRGLITINGSSAAAVGFTAGGADKGIILHTGTDMIMSNSVAGAITFQTTNTERARIPAAGGFQSKTTISVGDATPSLSGAGITFPASQSASSDANTLDDYEEGTFTPSLGGNTTYNGQSGNYIKIGKMVYVEIQMFVNSIGTGSTSIVSGLPFTSATQVTGARGGLNVNSFYSTASNVGYIGVYVNSAATTVQFQSTTTATTSVSTNAIFGNSTDVYFSGCYYAAN
jgi:hypothetical protein